jgi:arylsulfatase A-like enzyme
MKKIFGLVYLFLLAGVPFAPGAVSLDFNVASTNAGAARLYNGGGGMTFDFTVDGSGNVTLDVSTASAEDIDIDTVNGWDGSVGSVTNVALFNTSFKLAARAVRDGATGTITMDGTGPGVLGVQGQNSGRVDGATLTTPALESIAWMLSATDLEMSLATVDLGVMVNSSDMFVADGTQSNAFMDLNLGSEGSTNLSAYGYSLADGESLTFGQPVDSDNGFGLAGFSFDLISAVNNSLAIGDKLTNDVTVVMAGFAATYYFPGTTGDTFTVGSVATILTQPDSGGTGPIDLNGGGLVLEAGSEWILDGSSYSNAFNVGDRFVLAEFGSFNGYETGVRWRNFDLPADRDLQLGSSATSLYYEVVAQTPASGPNIIVINLDDVCADNYFGFEGRNSLTPALDSMVSNGIHFTRGYTTATVCAPSRYSLLTGRYPTRNTGDAFMAAYPSNTLARFCNVNVDLETDGEHIGNWLRQAGYRTGFVGKSHNIDPNIGNTAYWPDFGLVTYGQTDDPATNALVNGAMLHNQRVVSQLWRERGFDYVGGLYASNLLELRNDTLNFHHQEWVTEHALEFIDENSSQPFFLYMATTIDHGPIRDDLSKSLGSDPDYCPEGYRPGADYSFMPSRQSIIDEVAAGGYDQPAARMTWIDYSIQAITNKLAQYNLKNDTLIVFTADHGAETVDRDPQLTGKTTLYEHGMKVPLVMFWPNGIANPGRTCDELVQHIDFVPTFLELAGATGVPSRTVDGESLVPVLNGSSAAVRDELYCEIGYARGVRSKDWKYIALRYPGDVDDQIDAGYLWPNYGNGEYTEPRPYYVSNSSLGYYAELDNPNYYDDDQLYSMADDPTERTNLYGTLSSVQSDMKTRLAAYVSDIPGRPFGEFSSMLNVPTGVVELAFSNTLTNRLVGVPIQLDFTVDGDGLVSLDASTTSSDADAVSIVESWSGAVAWFTNSVTFNSSFSLTISAENESGSANVTLTEFDPGGLGVQGQNSSRIDGGGLATPNVETLCITPSCGAAEVVFQTLEWNNGINGSLMTASLDDAAATNTIGTSGSWSLSGFSAASGEALELSTASANGCALTGLSFSLEVADVEPGTNALPNVVVILADDLGYSDISYNPYSAPEVSTPNIDGLIRSGVWFSDAYATGNICAPSRAGFLSGCYQQRIGVHDEGDVNAASFSYTYPYFPQHLKQQFDGIEDYACQFVGKWHQGRDRTASVSIDGNTNSVFTEFDYDYGTAAEQTMLYHPMKRGFDTCYGFINLGGQSYWNYEYGFFDDLWRFECDTPVDGVDDGDALETYLTTRFTEKACDFIETQSAADQPFFVYLSYNAVHTPMEAPASPDGLSEGDEGWYPDADWYDANYPDMGQTPSYVYDTMSDADKQANRAILMAMLYHMDQGIGQVLQTLEDQGVRDNTIVIFWSDNGGSQASVAANDPLRERKHFNYDGGVRVPMTLSWPDVLGAYSNTTVSAPVMSIDLLPTVLDAAGIEPLNGFDALDGKSLLPLIRGEVDSIHESLCWSEGGDTGEYAIRQGDWKLYIDEDVYELYNLRDDIGETNDLSALYPDRLRAMRQDFFAWMSEMTDDAGDDIDERLWTLTPDGSTNAAIQAYSFSGGTLEIEYDETADSGTGFETTGNLVSNVWKTVTPDSQIQLDRYLDQSTYRVEFTTDDPKKFFRIK